MEDAIWWALSLGIIAGIFLALWLKERKQVAIYETLFIWRCVHCNSIVKFQQQCCQDCGRRLQWDWFQRKPFMMTRYQTNEQFRKWDILVPNIEQKED